MCFPDLEHRPDRLLEGQAALTAAGCPAGRGSLFKANPREENQTDLPPKLAPHCGFSSFPKGGGSMLGGERRAGEPAGGGACWSPGAQMA